MGTFLASRKSLTNGRTLKFFVLLVFSGFIQGTFIEEGIEQRNPVGAVIDRAYRLRSEIVGALMGARFHNPKERRPAMKVKTKVKAMGSDLYPVVRRGLSP